MRAFWIGLVALAASPAFAAGAPVSAGQGQGYATTDIGGADVPTVNRGDLFAIACDDIGAAGADVRVVMALSDAPGAAPTGFNAVLATNQMVISHSVQVHVPDLADLANRTVTVKVYVTDANGTRACDAGRVHIV